MSISPVYAAGLIDGEGCIHLDVPKGTYRARVSIGMTEPALHILREMQEEWGGTIYLHRPATDRWAAAYTWHVTGESAVALIRAIRPHLRLKGGQADAAVEVEQIRLTLPNRRNGQKLWDDETRAKCEKVRERMRAMNAKGPRVPALSAGGA